MNALQRSSRRTVTEAPMRRFLATLMLTVVASASGLPSNAVAQDGAARPQSEPIDPRIRVLEYDANSIVSLRGHLGYQMLIEFDPNERIENVAIGDSISWQVTPNRAATMLFLKPISTDAATNMTVVTSLRRYSFELRASEARGPSDPNIIYTLRFHYPDASDSEPAPQPEPQPRNIEPQALNLDYSTRGTDRFGDVRVFDDGQQTYFLIQPNAETPAVFLIGQDGEEELVNFQTRPPYIVVSHVAERYVLRSGRHRLRIRNEAYEQSGVAASPPTNAGGLHR